MQNTRCGDLHVTLQNDENSPDNKEKSFRNPIPGEPMDNRKIPYLIDLNS